MALAVASSGAAFAQQPTLANNAAPQVAYDIPAGALGPALIRYAAESGFTLSFEPALAQGQRTAGLHGRYKVADGFKQLLADSGLEAVPREGGGYTLRKATPAAQVPVAAAGAKSLSEVRVTAQNSDDGITEGTGSYTTTSATAGTGMALALREIPQSVSVFTRQQMDDQGIQSVEDMVQQTTGMTISRGAPERAEFLSRAFNISTLILDGVPMAMDNDFYGSNTLAMFDHAEILRGAAGLLIGTGDPSGVISLTRKHPTNERKVSITGSVGRWNNYRGEIDAGGPLNEAGTLRGRAVLAYKDTDTFTANYSHNRTLLYGTLDADIARGTTLSVGASYNEEVNDGSSWYGLPTASDGSFLAIDRSANMTPSWTYWNKTNKRVFVDLAHKLDNGWKTKLSAYAMETDLSALLTSNQRVNGTQNLRVAWAGTSEYTQSHRGLQLTADGPFTLLGRRHELIMGATYRTTSLDQGGESQSGYSFQYNPLQWQDLSNAPHPVYNASWGRVVDDTKQSGLYTATRLSLADSLKLIVGGRLDWYEYANDGVVAYTSNKKFTPYAGLVYDLNDTYSVYGSWTRIFKPQDYQGRNGQVLDPLQGTNLEAGVKAEFFGGALNASAAVFDIRQTNLPMALDLSECLPTQRSCYAKAGEVESKGIEFDVAGEVRSGWMLSAGYTYNIAEHIQDSDEADAGTRYRPDQPRHLFKVSTTYRLPGELNAWRVGATARMQNRVFSEVGSVRIQQGGYTVFDLMASWQVNKQLDVRANLVNALDKVYYESLGSSTVNGNGFGTPRNLTITARYQF